LYVWYGEAYKRTQLTVSVEKSAAVSAYEWLSWGSAQKSVFSIARAQYQAWHSLSRKVTSIGFTAGTPFKEPIITLP